MSKISQLRNALAKRISKNAMSVPLPKEFLKHGNRYMASDWSTVVMSDNDLYTGYGYSAIRNRANIVANTAIENVRTESKKPDYVHPYLDLIRNSLDFSEYEFWANISTYIDLEGVFYLMAVRSVGESSLGDVQYFKMLNPYNIQRVLSNDTLEVQGYIERRKGFSREIPKEMIIEIRQLNPFDEDNPYAMTDAAKEGQFTLKTASDYTRHALKNNINAPGILSTDIILDEEEFKNFRARVLAHVKGEPMFANGAGAIKWDSMQTELSKAALKDVNEINRELLFAVSGVSKTIMGIEQSGTTRETSRVQKEMIIEYHLIPQIRLITDALNLDYRRNYSDDFEKTEAMIVVDSPLSVDLDAKLKEVELSKEKLDLYQTLINKDISNDVAEQYVMGEIEVGQLPLEKSLPIIPEDTKEKDEEPQDVENKLALNKLNEDIIKQQQNSLKNEIVNIDGRLVSTALNRLRKIKNEVEIDKESDLIKKTEKKEFADELNLTLGLFYAMVFNIMGSGFMSKRTLEYGLTGSFQIDKKTTDAIKSLTGKVSKSHIDTISSEIYKVAKEEAKAGKSLSEIESILTQRYSGQISEARATVVARTETNRAFTMSQFEADKQFIEQNDLSSVAYKQWRTRSSNPCEFCQALEKQGPVPFGKNFKNLGDSIVVGDKSLNVDFVPLEAGNAHPNCSCTYELVLEL
jgi:hypothetical protein